MMAKAARQSGAKLFGRAFYESIGSPKLVLAPMVDHSEAAWRMLTRSFIPDSSKNLLAYSPMLHSRLLSNSIKYQMSNFSPFPVSLETSSDYENANGSRTDYYLDGHPDLDRPLTVQFCSNTPEDFLAGARIVEAYCDAVDLNLGCPQGIARRGHYGAFLQEDWDLIYRMINKLHNELSIPVTAKIRILETKEKTLEYAKMVLSAGASIITVHGRQRFQKGHYTGLADWTVLRYLRENLPADTVIFANGNVLQYEDIWRCLDATGADAVMSAEGALADPTIFAEPPLVGQEGREYWRGSDGRGGFRMDAVLRRYMDIIYEHVLHCRPPRRKPLFTLTDQESKLEGEEFQDPIEYASALPITDEIKIPKKQDLITVNLRVMQSHMFHLLRPLVAKHTDIRDKLAKCRVGDIAGFEAVLQMVEGAVKQGLIDYEVNAQDSESPADESQDVSVDQSDELNALTSEAAIRRCRRPWFVCQPYIRPLPREAVEKGAITLGKKETEAQRHLGAMNERAAGLSPGGKVVDIPMSNAGQLDQTIAVPQQGMVSG